MSKTRTVELGAGLPPGLAGAIDAPATADPTCPGCGSCRVESELRGLPDPGDNAARCPDCDWRGKASDLDPGTN